MKKDAMGRFSISSAMVPVGAELAALNGRLQELNQITAGAEDVDIACAVAEMFIGYGASRMDAQTARDVTARYTRVLQGFPLWAVEQASDNISKGKAGRSKKSAGFAPTVEELYSACEAAMAWAKTEFWQINSILTAKITDEAEKVETTPEQRREMIERMRAQGLLKTYPTGEADGR